MVVAAGEILVPGPAVLQRQELVHIRAGVDHRLVTDVDAGGAAIDAPESGCVDLREAHWQASQSSSSTVHATAGAARTACVTAFSRPSVPCNVDFSTCELARDRR